jgi:hypothetical protein
MNLWSMPSTMQESINYGMVDFPSSETGTKEDTYIKCVNMILNPQANPNGNEQ